MRYLIKMAWQNLGRNRGRTLLSFMAVSFGVLIIILYKGFVDAAMDTSFNYNINLNSGHVRLIRSEYAVKERLLSLFYPIGENGKTYSEIIQDIRGLPEVTNAFGRIRFGMMLVVGDEHKTILGVGADMAQEEKRSNLTRFLKGKGSGRLPQAENQEILLGIDVMRKLKLKVGDKVNAIFTTSLGSFKIATFRVVGELASGLKMLDAGIAYLPLDQTMKLLEMDDMVTEIVVFGKNSGKTDSLTAELKRYLHSQAETLKIIPWYKYSDLVSALVQFNDIYLGFYILTLVLTSFVVFNTLMMVVKERTREIGMLSALGMTAREIRSLFILEGSIVAVIGSLLGTIVGGMSNWIMSLNGIDFSAMFGSFPKEITMYPRVYPSYSFSVLLFSFLLGVFVTIVAAYLPARRAVKLNPTQALRTI